MSQEIGEDYRLHVRSTQGSKWTLSQTVQNQKGIWWQAGHLKFIACFITSPTIPRLRQNFLLTKFRASLNIIPSRFTIFVRAVPLVGTPVSVRNTTPLFVPWSVPLAIHHFRYMLPANCKIVWCSSLSQHLICANILLHEKIPGFLNPLAKWCIFMLGKNPQEE